MSPRAPFAHPTAPRLPDPATLPETELVAGGEPALVGVEVSEVALRGGTLANAPLARSSWRGVLVSRVRMTGVQLAGARLTDVLFEECLLDLAILTEARLERVAFRDCRLTGGDLGDLRGHDTSFTGCDLSDTDLSGARFTRTAMFGCRLEGARDLACLKGVGMRWSDVIDAAGAFADALEIHVVE